MVHPAGNEQDGALSERATADGVHPREDDDLERALKVLQRGDGHGLLIARDDGPQGGHDAAHDHSLAIERLVPQIARVGRHVLRDLLG
jgi:hypothetical protein